MCVCMYVHVCMYVCMYVLYVCMYTCTCIYNYSVYLIVSMYVYNYIYLYFHFIDRKHVIDVLPHLWMLDGQLITGKQCLYDISNNPLHASYQLVREKEFFISLKNQLLLCNLL